MSLAAHIYIYMGFPHGLDSKESACNAWDPGLIPGLGRLFGEGNGYALQYSWTLVNYSPQGHIEVDTAEMTEHACKASKDPL